MNIKLQSQLVFAAFLSLLLLFSYQSNPVEAQTVPAEWPMAGANPERTSWTPETLPGNIKTVWVKPIEPLVSQHVQVIASENKVFVSTAKGLFAFDASTGSQVWVYPTELPLGHSPTYNNGFLYVGGVDRRLHKVNAASGEGVWTFSAEGGFYTNPVVIGNIVYAGNRDGAFYAVTTDTGSLVWKYQTGNQILQSPAYKDNILYFASNDGFAYALNAVSGALVWKSTSQLPSMGQYSWWPVIYQDYVIFTRAPFEGGLTGQETPWLFCPPTNQACSIPNNLIPGRFTDSTHEISNQPTMDVSINPNGSTYPDYFEKFPYRKNAVFLNIQTGIEQQFDIDNDGTPDAAPISWLGDAGTRYPPIVSGFDNVLYFHSVNRSFGSFSSATLSGWKVGTPYINLPYSTNFGQSGAMPADEPSGIAGAGNKVYWNHCCDRYVGSVDISQRNTDFFSSTDDSNREWRYLNSNGLPFLSWPTNIGMPNNYFSEAVKFFWDPQTTSDPPGRPAVFWNENDKVGPTVYGGKLYVILGNALVAMDPTGLGSTAPKLSPATTSLSTATLEPLSTLKLQTRLEQQITNLVNRPHFKPSYDYVGLLTPNMKNKFDDFGLQYWHNPADLQTVLLRALPHLSVGLQSQVKSYLQSEFANYSPLQYSHIGWTSGGQRDTYPYPPTDTKYFPLNFGPVQFVDFSGWSQPPHNIYAVWKYAAAGLGDPATLFNQVRTKLKAPITLNKPALTDSYLAGFPHVHNAYIAGYKGYVELAKLANQDVSVYQPFQNELDRLLALRVANLTAFPIPSTTYAPSHGYFNSLITAWNFMYLTPELSEYLANHASSAVLDIINKYQAIAPYWMVARNGETQGEDAIMPYQQTYSLFQAIAQLKHASQEDLSKYLDSPIVPVGDLYYIDNLVSVLEAPSNIPTPSPEPSPPPFRGDANGDSLVNDADLTIWQENFGATTTNGPVSGDFNVDTLVDGVDYAIWHKTYGY